MAKYELYGIELISNDDTLKDFALCLYNNCPMEAIMEDGEERKDFIMNLVFESLRDDISRTDINYEDLLYKYRNEIGDVLYEMDNRGISFHVEFFGENAINFFNDLVYWYIYIRYEDFIK